LQKTYLVSPFFAKKGLSKYASEAGVRFLLSHWSYIRVSKKIYKYVGPDIIDLAFKKEGYLGFKFSYPKDYNDPYELFLTIDFGDDPEIAAFYNEIVQEIQQYPTTCFSNSPIVTPMWAHYAHNSKGFVIEIDEDMLKGHIESASIGDVTYQDAPREELAVTFQMAHRRGKPRDIMFLRNGVQSAAYFTKHSCWSYESERRLVVSDSEVSNIDGNMISFIPTECVTAIISGPRTKAEYIIKGKELSDTIETRYFEAKIGKSNSKPYFIGQDSGTYIFDGNNIVEAINSCCSCNEPVGEYKEFCLWCSITEDDQENAAFGNPLRAFSDVGMLEGYIKGFNSIGKKT